MRVCARHVTHESRSSDAAAHGRNAGHKPVGEQHGGRVASASGRRASQNASLLPKPPGTRLMTPITCPRKNVWATAVSGSTEPLARRHSANARQASTQSAQPIAARVSVCVHWPYHAFPCRHLMITPASATISRLNRNASGASDQIPIPVRSDTSAASVQPASPDENATATATTPSCRSER